MALASLSPAKTHSKVRLTQDKSLFEYDFECVEFSNLFESVSILCFNHTLAQYIDTIFN